TFAIDKNTIHEIQEVVARRSICTPIRWHFLLRAEDLFDHEIASGKTFKIGLGIQQTIHVINAQTTDLSVRQEFQREVMRRAEPLVLLRPEGDQITNIKEAPVVDGVCGLAPKRQTIMLA